MSHVDLGKFVDRSGGDEPTDTPDYCSGLKKRCREKGRRDASGSYRKCFVDAARDAIFGGEFLHPDKVDQVGGDTAMQTEAFQRLNTCIGPPTEYGLKTPDVHDPQEMGWRTEEESREAQETRERNRKEFDRVMTERVHLNPTELDRLWKLHATSGTRIGKGQPVHFSSGHQAFVRAREHQFSKKGGRRRATSGRTRKGGGQGPSKSHQPLVDGVGMGSIQGDGGVGKGEVVSFDQDVNKSNERYYTLVRMAQRHSTSNSKKWTWFPAIKKIVPGFYLGPVQPAGRTNLHIINVDSDQLLVEVYPEDRSINANNVTEAYTAYKAQMNKGGGRSRKSRRRRATKKRRKGRGSRRRATKKRIRKG